MKGDALEDGRYRGLGLPCWPEGQGVRPAEGGEAGASVGDNSGL